MWREACWVASILLKTCEATRVADASVTCSLLLPALMRTPIQQNTHTHCAIEQYLSGSQGRVHAGRFGWMLSQTSFLDARNLWIACIAPSLDLRRGTRTNTNSLGFNELSLATGGDSEGCYQRSNHVRLCSRGCGILSVCMCPWRKRSSRM